MPHFKIDYSTYGETIREPNDDDNWDRGDTDASYSIHGFEIVGDNDYFDGSISFEPDYKTPYFLLYVMYGTGDSFGSDGGQLLIVDLFENMETAKKNEEIIRNHGEDHSITLVTEYKGKLTKYKTDAPWVGYFEWLEDVYIERVWRK